MLLSLLLTVTQQSGSAAGWLHVWRDLQVATLKGLSGHTSHTLPGHTSHTLPADCWCCWADHHCCPVGPWCHTRAGGRDKAQVQGRWAPRDTLLIQGVHVLSIHVSSGRLLKD